MELKNRATIQEVKWKDVREVVMVANQKFATVIDQMAPDNDFILYKVRYPFGSVIVKAGSFYVPAPDGQLVPLADHRISDKLKQAIGYNSGIPTGIVLENSIELFMRPKGRTIPFAMMKKGKIFALWRVLNPMSYLAPQVWHIVAGARDMFLLPKITDATSYRKLAKARGIKLPMPRSLLEHGPMLAQIAHHRDFPEEWYAELLFFPPVWLKPRNDNGWIRFHHYLLQEAWENTEHWRNKVVYDYVWDSFIKELTEQNIKVTPHLVDIVKHLILIGLGVLPGFAPAVDNDEGPMDAFKDDIVNIYGLRRFAPTIMVPRHFSLKDGRSIYWSLQLPTYFESTPKPRTPNSIIEELREIKVLLDEFCFAVLDNRLEGLVGTPIPDIFRKISYDFFHSEPDLDDGIKHSKDMVEEDKLLIKSLIQHGQRGFSEISPFVRGCVRMSVTKK